MKTVMWKGNRIPADLAQLGAGKDAGSRLIVVTYARGGVAYRLCDSESAAVCQACYDDPEEDQS